MNETALTLKEEEQDESVEYSSIFSELEKNAPSRRRAEAKEPVKESCRETDGLNLKV